MDNPLYLKINNDISRNYEFWKNRVDRSLRENGRANIYDRTDNPNAVHAKTPGTRVTVTDCGRSQRMKFRVSARSQQIGLFCSIPSIKGWDSVYKRLCT